jgi:molybdopterin synthase catalytic subunit/molybdopterin synthase sulfur carrier subunit
LHVHVRLGAGLSNLAGRAQLQVELPPGATVDDLLRRVGDDHPDIASGLGSALTVVGGSQAGSDRELEEGERVALLLPVAGGGPFDHPGGGS